MMFRRNGANEKIKRGRDIALCFAVLTGFTCNVFAATFVVNSTGDAADVAPGNGTCSTGGTNSQSAVECTLRASIEEANALAGTDTINFNMPVTEPGYTAAPLSYTTQPATPIPPLLQPVLIDGRTQPDFPGTPIIVLSGPLAGGGVTGIVFADGSDGSTIRGLQVNQFMANGIEIQAGADGIFVEGNWIGSDGTGSTVPGNGSNGINILGANATIGGTGALDRNVINNNGNEGINLTGGSATGNNILGNYIGLENDGVNGSGNNDVGIAILSGASGTTVGGLTPASRNGISMNFEGMEINSNNNVVIGNYIGTDAGGSIDRGSRSDDGIEIQSGASGNTIGGTAAGAGNLIAFNQLHGVNIAAGTGNTVLGNAIHSNDQRGIDLGNDGVTVNDAGDGDSGANQLLNFPVITSASESGSSIDVDFNLDVPAGDYRIEFFTNPLGSDPSGNGEGQVFADAITVTHGGTGVEPFTHSFTGSAGDVITSTATQEFAGPTYGSTSEFSAAVTANAGFSCGSGIVNNINDSGNRSLRECILFANANPGTTISFDIPGSGNRSSGADEWFAIVPLTPLPAITAAGTIIDGTTQTTNRGDSNTRGPEIEIDGATAGAIANGLAVSATGGGSTIRGLAIGNFSDNGVLLRGSNNTVAGNYLGLSADGTTVAANNSNDVSYQGGIRVESNGNTVGGTSAADRNVISGNLFAGIELFGSATANVVYGNYIGTDATGTLDRGNSQEGIDLEFAGGNTVGGPLAGQRNIISGNGSDGIEIDGGDFNIIQNNYIGTDVTGTLLIPNVRDGIDINENGGDGTTNTLVGGPGANEGNLIRGNLIYGVQTRGVPATNNAVIGNRIFGNGTLDLDLNDDGVTTNDPLDADGDPNDLLNYPEIVTATEVGAIITVYFNLDVPAGDYRIEFFTNPSGTHASGNGGGEVFAGATTVTSAGAGTELFAYSFAGFAGDTITATATEELAGPTYASTSEFSAPFTAIAGVPFEARWPLDETSGLVAADILAGNDGAYRNNVLLNQPAACAITGNGVYFDGVDDYVEIPHSADYVMDEGTVTLWVNIDAIGTEQMLFSKDHLNFGTGGHLTLSVQPGGDLQTRLQSTTASMYVNTAPVSAGTWIHVAFSWGAGGMAMYVDGGAPVTDPYVGGLGITSGDVGNSEPIALGSSTVVSGVGVVTPLENYFAGFMDDVRIYNRALTQPEIQALASCTPAVTLNLVKRAFWPDGTPIPTGATIPSGVEFKYLLYINNQVIPQNDVSVRDVLDPAFQYQAGTIQVDNSIAECAAAICTPAEEQAIFAAINATPALTDAVDGDVASYTGAGTVIDAGNGTAANAQLNINGDAVWALMFSAKMP